MRRNRELAEQLGEAMSRLHTILRRQVAPTGVSVTQARTLSDLLRDGPQRVTQLAVTEQVSQPSMSTLVMRLTAAGLVQRVGGNDDGRVVNVTITDAGKEALQTVVKRRGDVLERALRAQSKQDRAALVASLPALERLITELHRMAAEDAASPPA